ncbi:MAG: type II secretion system protein [Candidatus Eremiobacteraeota bacterium]|nr:type II secretion system protein [Candidatus Eremiobacteraeota bacterium]MCW5872328.1 type II secretion system protein [Candidatus Eremiobacteraeota bacterium]
MKRKKAGFTLIELMIVIAIIAILAAILVPNFLKARAQGQLTACKSNCKNIATALEMYSSDNGGRYPTQGSFTQQLTSGNYLKLIPTCPAAGGSTYAPAYTSTQTPDSFSFYCTGNNHAKAYTGFSTVSGGFPQYSAESGLLDHP